MKNLISALLQKLKPLFFKAEAVLITDPPVVVEGVSGLMQPHVVVPRADCLFIHLDMSAVPRQKLYQAVYLRVIEIAPFSNPGFSAVKFGKFVSVWYWDNSRVLSLVNQYGLPSAKETLFIAESVAMSSPLKTSWLSFDKGYENQVWESGILVESRWVDFAQVDEKKLENEIQDQVYEPVFNSSGYWPGFLLPPQVISCRIRLGFLVVLLIWLMAMTYEASGMLRYKQLDNYYQLAFEEIVEESAPILDARNMARRTQSQNQNLMDKLVKPSQALLMVEVDRNLPTEAELKSWTYSQGRLSIVIDDNNADLVEYIKTYEASELFFNVSVEPHNRNSMIVLQMDVAGAQS